jgi:hypothetical protein
MENIRMTKQITSVLLVLAALSASLPALGQDSQELATCLTDSLNGSERKQLAQWIFFGMSSHPDLTVFASIPPEARDEMNQTIGALITRLITEDCSAQSASAIRIGGQNAIQSAFEVVGAVAMQELMIDQNVSVALSNFEKYLDLEKFSALGSQ